MLVQSTKQTVLSSQIMRNETIIKHKHTHTRAHTLMLIKWEMLLLDIMHTKKEDLLCDSHLSFTDSFCIASSFLFLYFSSLISFVTRIFVYCLYCNEMNT